MEQPGIDERVTIRWPDGPYDFVLTDVFVRPVPDFEDWYVLTGFVVEPVGVQHQTRRGFYAKRVDDGYETVPAKRRPALEGGPR